MSKSQVRSQKRVRFAAADKFRSTLNRRVNQYFENIQHILVFKNKSNNYDHRGENV